MRAKTILHVITAIDVAGQNSKITVPKSGLSLLGSHMTNWPCLTQKNRAYDYKRHLIARTIKLGLPARAPLVSLVPATLQARGSGLKLTKLIIITTEQPLLLTFTC